MSLGTGTYKYLQKWIKNQAGISFPGGKDSLMETRLASVICKHNFSDAGELISQLEQGRNTALDTDVIDAITNHETSFFRDRHPFDYIRKTLFPNLLKMGASSKRLAVWSAGCSTGQEIYSVAIIIKEYFSQVLDWELDLYGTDIADHTLDRARKGEYTDMEMGRCLSAILKNKYFESLGEGRWAIRDDIRKMVKFRHINLAERWPRMSPFHLIFMRNVLIYFDEAERERILHRLRIYLKRNGSLVLGSSENILNQDELWEYCHENQTVFYRLSGF